MSHSYTFPRTNILKDGGKRWLVLTLNKIVIKEERFTDIIKGVALSRDSYSAGKNSRIDGVRFAYSTSSITIIHNIRFYDITDK